MTHSACGRNAGMQVKLCYPLTVCAIPERLRDISCGGAVQIDYLYLYLYSNANEVEQLRDNIDSNLFSVLKCGSVNELPDATEYSKTYNLG